MEIPLPPYSLYLRNWIPLSRLLSLKESWANDFALSPKPKIEISRSDLFMTDRLKGSG